MDTRFVLLFWFKNFSFIIILITFQVVISEFSRCFKCILNIFENQQKIQKKSQIFFFSKNFLHNHYLKLFLYWFTRNCDFNCGGWTCWMKRFKKTIVLALYSSWTRVKCALFLFVNQKKNSFWNATVNTYHWEASKLLNVII